MKIEFPLLVLGYSQKRVFSIETDEGHVLFPIFYDAEKAEAFRIFFGREHKQKLEAFVIADAQVALPFFRHLLIADPGLQGVVLDPPPPVDGKEGGHTIPYLQFLEQLRGQFRKHMYRRRNRHKMVGNHRPTRTKKV